MKIDYAKIPDDAPFDLLTERERLIIERRRNGDTRTAIAFDLGISSDRVRQIEQRSHRVLTDPIWQEARRMNPDRKAWQMPWSSPDARPRRTKKRPS
jgi:hypothetical protein